MNLVDKEEVAAQAGGQEGVTQAEGAQVATTDKDYQALLARQEAHIKELEGQVADAAKTAEAADALRGEIEQVKAQAADERVEFELRLAGVRNVKAAKALLDEHAGDVAALKPAEPWLFSDGRATGVDGTLISQPIYANASWTLPTSGISGSQCFYNCTHLVGGNGTAYASSKTSYTYMRIDRTGQAGYLTAG